ncbi:MAG: acyl carrier protein [Candidatus Brocadia sp.]|jgi:acyl carrier protein|nr:hypothetical protein [Candidatus Brocadia fulgida]MCC6325479.1 acyl carrier protein [Candidatus Brocadia sp.]MCE7910193.1 acyl carrier protein [Candidatus Brocadia sp. AMX3]OQZ03158.1 MAG: hypothetical protein B6D35_00235 [Candidatus Brocadia sp. UTAMX2]MDG5996844.1 acyl carrier protein [Candidatus Brocadia sp.]
MDVENGLKEFIVKELMHETDNNLIKNDDSLLEKNIIDSTGIFQLVRFIDEQFEIKVSDDELIPENFESINAMVRFINQKHP